MKRLRKFLLVPIAAVATFGAAPAATSHAQVPGDPGVSGCWQWDVSNGCTMYANCYVSAGHCIVSETFYGFSYSYIVTF